MAVVNKSYEVAQHSLMMGQAALLTLTCPGRNHVGSDDVMMCEHVVDAARRRLRMHGYTNVCRSAVSVAQQGRRMQAEITWCFPGQRCLSRDVQSYRESKFGRQQWIRGGC
jgi:hypothetical protein